MSINEAESWLKGMNPRTALRHRTNIANFYWEIVTLITAGEGVKGSKFIGASAKLSPLAQNRQ
jgi:hypothetical protein